MCKDDDLPPAPSPMQQARSQIMIERERARLAEEAQAAQEARAAAERTRLGQEFDTNLGAAYNRSLGYAQSRVGEKGLNWDEFAPSITAELDRIRSSIPRLDSNPGSYFGDNVPDTVLNRIRDNRRSQYGQQAEQLAPGGFERNEIGDTFDDSVLNAIYGEQYGEANDMLQRAFARGNLSPIGINAAQKQLETQGRAGMSRLQDLGGGVLSNYRSELADVGNRARSRASGYELGQSFDLNPFREELNSRKANFGQRLEGDIRNATRGENLFNVDELIAKGGTSQGLYNPSTSSSLGSSPIFDALKARGIRRNEQRGLGSSGGTF